MTQDEVNKELDGALEEAIFNGDITPETTAEEIRDILTCMVQVTEEQYQLYAIHCLQLSIERKQFKPTEGSVQ